MCRAVNAHTKWYIMCLLFCYEIVIIFSAVSPIYLIFLKIINTKYPSGEKMNFDSY